MTFLHPWMLLLLAVLPLLAGLLKRSRRLQARAAETLRGPGGSGAVRLTPTDIRQLAVLVCLILALGRPAWNPRLSPQEIQGRDLVIALDVSRSMLAEDVFPSRLAAARNLVFESLPQLSGQRLSLITFSGSAHVRVPLTLDHGFMQYRLNLASPGDADIGSTALQAPIEKAIDTVLPESEKGRQDLILFTDGEDHLSNLEDTARQLNKSGLRVLIIGLGDPVDGARIPDAEEPGGWMKHKDRDVITRLNEAPLQQLAEASPQIQYYAAGTRPFDLMKIYRDMVQDTTAIVISDNQQRVYTEGYPLLLALALLFGFAPLPRKTFRALLPAFMLGCSQQPALETDLYPERMQAGRTAWTEARALPTEYPALLLVEFSRARETFLQAALLRPGDEPAASYIAGLSARIRELEVEIAKQQAVQKDLQQLIEELTRQLRLRVQDQQQLTQASNDLLRRKPPATPDEKRQAVPLAREAQRQLNGRTSEVLTGFKSLQTKMQEMLKAAFNEQGTPPTDLDDAITQLSQGHQHQRESLPPLNPESPIWHQAHNRQQQALRHLRAALADLDDQNQGSAEASSEEEFMEMDYDEEMEWSETEANASQSLNAMAMDTRTALQSRWQAPPNFSPADILNEEQANQEKRAQQKAAQAGAKVEKNW